MIRIGPAGWSYPDWEGRVYPRHKPPAFHPLPYLARFVNCVEINSSFYAMPRAEHAANWLRLVHDFHDFRFAVKLNQDFTHLPQQEPAIWRSKAETFRAGIEPLLRGHRLSALLVQFPVSFMRGPQEVRRMGRIARLFDGLPLVVELRHHSWFEPPGIDTVRGLGMSLAHIDLPAAWNHPPLWHEPTGPVGYLRLHGRNEAQWFRKGAGRDDRYDYLYSPEELGPIADKARRLLESTRDTYIVTNNHFGGQAMANALELKAMLIEPSVSVPPDLIDHYPRLEGIARIEGQQRLF